MSVTELLIQAGRKVILPFPMPLYIRSSCSRSSCAMQGVLLIFHLENFTDVRKAFWKSWGGRTVDLIILKATKASEAERDAPRKHQFHMSVL
jgi:hypothetical protein